MLTDPICSPFFAKTNMEVQARREKEYVIMITGGPHKYDGADMKTAHKGMNLGKKEFDQTWLNL